MSVEILEIRSIQDLLEQLSIKKAATKTFWYRGQSTANWPLLPGYMRLGAPPSEATLLSRFKQNATRLLDFVPSSTFDWMFLMQHYGVPTRLLDWSENPLAGLYFAVAAAENDEDGALWMLDPVKLNEFSNVKNEDEPSYIPSFDDDEVEGYSIASLKNRRHLRLQPIATIATRNNARIQAQAGVFTIHHLLDTPIEGAGDGSHVTKFIIPDKSKPELKAQLQMLGFTRFHLFPELESVGVSVREGV
jgi:hypothetical protein